MGRGTPASSSTVGKMSYVVTTYSETAGVIRVGHRTRPGSRMPPSHVVVLPGHQQTNTIWVWCFSKVTHSLCVSHYAMCSFWKSAQSFRKDETREPQQDARHTIQQRIQKDPPHNAPYGKRRNTCHPVRDRQQNLHQQRAVGCITQCMLSHSALLSIMLTLHTHRHGRAQRCRR